MARHTSTNAYSLPSRNQGARRGAQSNQGSDREPSEFLLLTGVIIQVPEYDPETRAKTGKTVERFCSLSVTGLDNFRETLDIFSKGEVWALQENAKLAAADTLIQLGQRLAKGEEKVIFRSPFMAIAIQRRADPVEQSMPSNDALAAATSAWDLSELDKLFGESDPVSESKAA